MRAELREAVRLIVQKGYQIGKAAEAAGLHPVSLSRALARPPIRAYLEEQKALYCLDADQLKGRAKAMAINAGIDLMHNAQSEAVRARMVELFAGEGGKGAQLQVTINNDRGGYEFVRPGQRIVDITPAIDGASDGDDA